MKLQFIIKINNFKIDNLWQEQKSKAHLEK